MCNVTKELQLENSRKTTIRWCVDCEKYELLIKGVRLEYDHEELITFCKSLAALSGTHYTYYLANEPEILLQDRASKSKFFLTYSESQILQDQINRTVLH